MKVEIEVPDAKIPAGYKVIGYRPPMRGDLFIYNCDGTVGEAQFNFTSEKIILKQIGRLRKLKLSEVDPNKEYRGYFTDVDREITFSIVEGRSPQHLFGIRVGNTDYPFLTATGERYRYFWVIEE